MDMIVLNKDSVVKQTIQNLVEAGVLRPSECSDHEAYLRQLDPKELIATLVESHDLRSNAPSPIMYYPIDMDAISKN